MKTLTFILAIFTSLQALGQEFVGKSEMENTQAYMQKFSSVDPLYSKSTGAFEAFFTKLEKKKATLSEKEFLAFVFTKTHQTFLKKYVPYASFNSLFTDGSYHCLTGTILYSLILNHFGIEHKVIETNYHIFLLAETSQGEILIEATDPQSGFVDSPEGIELRMANYKQQTIEATNSKLSYYKFSAELFKTVSLNEMEGLLYYNRAVDLFNKGEVCESVQYLVKANQFYTSSRIDEFSQLLLISLQQSKLDSNQKMECLKELVSIRQHAFQAVATLN